MADAIILKRILNIRLINIRLINISLWDSRADCKSGAGKVANFVYTPDTHTHRFYTLDTYMPINKPIQDRKRNKTVLNLYSD